MLQFVIRKLVSRSVNVGNFSEFFGVEEFKSLNIPELKNWSIRKISCKVFNFYCCRNWMDIVTSANSGREQLNFACAC